MRGGTLFSGIGAPECAAPEVNWLWCAEIDPFASAIHKARFPGAPNLGNILEVDWHAVGTERPVDLVVGGPPCQGFSVAGQRGGLADPRGNLSLAYVRALDAIDPTWSVTENVPGWLSMADNSFGHFLGLMVGADAPLVPGRGQRWTDSGVVAGPKRTAAWRILDAQFFGVPQRRRRVFVIAVRGARNWACAEALFPLQQSVRRHPAPRLEAGERVAATTARCVSGNDDDRGDGSDNLIAHAVRGKHNLSHRDDSDTLIAHCLRADGFDAGEDGTGPLAVAFRTNQTNAQGPIHSTEITDTLAQDHAPAVQQAMSVRRLLPVECEKLQGFPPGWTAITWRGKPAADGPRYRALGNAMAVPCVKWILMRLRDVDEILATPPRDTADHFSGTLVRPRGFG